MMALVFALFSITAHAADIPELPFAFEVKWDISKENNLLVQDFIVNKRDPINFYELIFSPTKQFQTREHAFEICIKFQSVDKEPSSEEWEQLRAFVGSGAYNSRTGKPVPSGVPIPVALKIEKIKDSNLIPVKPEKIIDTASTIGYSTNYMMRHVDYTGGLPAGKYRITVSTPHAIKLPPNIETYLSVNSGGGK